MKRLLDTHAMFWWLIDQSFLSERARSAIVDKNNAVLVSVASAWEIAIKVGGGKWPEASALLDDFEEESLKSGLLILPISVAHVRLAGLMPSPLRDPFDRLIAAQALVEGLTVVTADEKVRELGAPHLW